MCSVITMLLLWNHHSDVLRRNYIRLTSWRWLQWMPKCVGVIRMWFNVHSMVYVKLVLMNSVVWSEFLEVFFHMVNISCFKVKLIWSFFLLRLSLFVPRRCKGRGLATLILNFGSRWVWVVISQQWIICSWGKSHQYPFSRRLGGPQSGSASFG